MAFSSKFASVWLAALWVAGAVGSTRAWAYGSPASPASTLACSSFLQEAPSNAVALQSPASRPERRRARRDRFVLFSEAQSAFHDRQDLREAERLIDECLVVDPSWARARRLRAQILVRARRNAEAIPVLDGLIAQDSNDLRAMGLRTQALLGLGRRSDALAQVDAQLALDPANVVAMGLRTQVLLAMGWEKSSEAIAQAEAQVRVQEANGGRAPAVAYMLRGLAYLARPATAGRALADFDRILSVDPNDARAMGGRALALMSMDDSHAERALAQVRDLMARRPQDPYGPGLLGRALFRLERYAEAVENAGRFPRDSAAGTYGARALARLGQADAAVAYFRAAPPEDQAAKWNVAEIQFARGRFDLAQRALIELWLELSEREPGALHRWPLIGLLRIEREGSLRERSPEAEAALRAVERRHGAEALRDVVNESERVTWSFVAERAIAQQPSLANPFWASVETERLRPVDSWTRRSTF